MQELLGQLQPCTIAPKPYLQTIGVLHLKPENTLLPNISKNIPNCAPSKDQKKFGRGRAEFENCLISIEDSLWRDAKIFRDVYSPTPHRRQAV